MKLQDYTIEELRAELKRRVDLDRANKEKVKRCRMCIHYGEVNYYGKQLTTKAERRISKCCQFFSWGKNGKYRKCHAPSQHACEHVEPIINDEEYIHYYF